MKKVFYALLLLLPFSLLAETIQTNDEKPLIKTFFVFGKASFFDVKTKKWTPLQTGITLEEKSQIKTELKSFVILISQNKKYKIKERTTALISEILKTPDSPEKQEEIALLELQLLTANSLIKEAGIAFQLGLNEETQSQEKQTFDENELTPQILAKKYLDLGEFKKTLEIIKKNPKLFNQEEKNLLESLANLFLTSGYETIVSSNTLMTLRNLSLEYKALAIYFLAFTYALMEFNNQTGPLLELYIDSIKNSSQMANIYYLTAFGYKKAADQAKAETYYTQFIARYPEHSFIERAKKELEELKPKKGK